MPPKNWAFSGTKKGVKHWSRIGSIPRPGSRICGHGAANAAVTKPSVSFTKPVARKKNLSAIIPADTDDIPLYQSGDYEVAPCVYKVQINPECIPETTSPVKKKLPGSKLRIAGLTQNHTAINTLVHFVQEGSLIDHRRKGFEIVPHSWYDLPLDNEVEILDELYFPGDYILINQPETRKSGTISTVEDLRNFWVAEILEIRVESEEAVYLSIHWMYWPEELPTGRQPHHGAHELISSSHMDIIDAHTVAGLASVTPWNEYDDSIDDINPGDLYWRQSYNPRTQQITSPRRHCACKGYHNPDTVLVWCEACDSWLHEACLAENIKKDILIAAGIISEGAKNVEESKMRQVKVEWKDELSKVFVAFDGDEWHEKVKCLCCHCYIT
ncbi:hypothetical protein BZA77DRAFT_355857 [Pyronema omphalodes]|nr:hypothetical protein BZA77DRAFT_355857 [Pyronema omphalodes]